MTTTTITDNTAGTVNGHREVPVGHRTADYYFDLPQELIAQDPLEDRSSSRLLVLDRKTGERRHGTFRDILGYLEPGDAMILNDTKVIPARLLGTREGTGASVEILLLKRLQADVWECLVRPGKKLRPGARAVFGDGSLRAEILEIAGLGEMPLPPYITHKLQDRGRYQTVYARYEGSAAAPTAGLHFTPELLDEVRAKGVETGFVTLHVGLGTFRPVKVDDVEEHTMHTEWYNVPPQTADLINRTHQAGHRVICVGTTSCRTIESAADETGTVHAGSDDTSIFIYPGYQFRAMDALITNFHLPESTLIMLVSAFAGRENVLEAYKEAVDMRYRFFSFGDAMMIV